MNKPTNNQRILAALGKLRDVCEEINGLWDHTGTNMVDGYPLSRETGINMSWDEFTADVQNWLAVQSDIRKPVKPIAALEMALEIIGANLEKEKQDEVGIAIERIQECFEQMCRVAAAAQYYHGETVEWRPAAHPECPWRLGTVTNIQPEVLEIDNRYWVAPNLVRKKGEIDAKTPD